MNELEKILGEELSRQLADKLNGKSVLLDNGTLIPKHRFDCINISLREHKAKVALLNKQVTELLAKEAEYKKIERENAALSHLVVQLLGGKISNPKEEQ